jgi:hypothetical protein
MAIGVVDVIDFDTFKRHIFHRQDPVRMMKPPPGRISILLAKSSKYFSPGICHKMGDEEIFTLSYQSGPRHFGFNLF